MTKPDSDESPGAMYVDFGVGRDRTFVNPDAPVGDDDQFVEEIRSDLLVVVDRAEEQGCEVTAALASHSGDRVNLYTYDSPDGTFLDGSWLGDDTRFSEVFSESAVNARRHGLEPLQPADEHSQVSLITSAPFSSRA